MLRLYSGSGSSEIKLLGIALPPEPFRVFRGTVCELLRGQGDIAAAEVLETVPFELWNGTNGFGDAFELLFARVSPTAYVELAQPKPSVHDHRYGRIVDAFGALGKAIRFIAIDINLEEGTASVPSPSLRISSRTVEDALAQAETLIKSHGPSSGLDRVHTALHGYLEAACKDRDIEFSEDASIMTLFSLLREKHPSLILVDADEPLALKILRSLSKIIDAIDSVRNEHSLAHPNDALFQEAEAVLMINSVRTLLQYLDAKLN
jgi:hypothetical protein